VGESTFFRGFSIGAAVRRRYDFLVVSPPFERALHTTSGRWSIRSRKELLSHIRITLCSETKRSYAASRKYPARRDLSDFLTTIDEPFAHRTSSVTPGKSFTESEVPPGTRGSARCERRLHRSGAHGDAEYLWHAESGSDAVGSERADPAAAEHARLRRWQPRVRISSLVLPSKTRDRHRRLVVPRRIAPPRRAPRVYDRVF